MKEFDDIEQLFSSAFKDEAVTPPANVKANINGKLFGAKKLRIVYTLPILLLGIVAASIFFYNQDDEPVAKNKNTLNTTASSASSTSNKGSNKKHSNKKDSETDQNTNDYGSHGEHLVSRVGRDQTTEKKDVLIEQLTKQEKEQREQKAEIERIKEELRKLDLVKAKDSWKKDVLSQNWDDGSEKTKTGERSEGKGENSGDEKTDTDGPAIKLRDFVLEDKIDFDKSSQMERVSEVEALAIRPAYSFPNPTKASAIDTSFNPKPPKNKLIRFSELAIYSGLTGGINKIRQMDVPLIATTYDLKESNGYSFSAEFGFQFRGIQPSLGLEYVRRQENYNVTFSNMLDSTLTSSVWIVDSVSMDSTLYNTYAYSTSEKNESIRMRSEAFSIPLYIRMEYDLTVNFKLGLSAGVNFSYLKTTLLENSGASIVPDQKSFGMSFLLRPDIRYSFGRYAIGVYARAGYNFMTGTIWDTTKRARLEGGVGVSLSYRF